MPKSKNLNSPHDIFSADRPADAALVSALVDGEVPPEALPEAFRQVAADAALAQTWQRYYLLREAMHGGLPAGQLPDVTEKVMTAIAALSESEKNHRKPEASAKAPAHAKKPAQKSKHKTARSSSDFSPFSLWWPAMSLAATFALILLLWPVVTSLPHPDAAPLSAPLLATLPPADGSLEAIAARPLTPADLAETLDADWPILLREHAAYQEVLPTMLPYTRMPLLRTASSAP